MPKKTYEQFYEWMSHVYEPAMTSRHYFEDDRYANIVDAVAEEGPGLQILDVGVGNGWVASLYGEGNTVHGIDISDRQLEQSKALGIQPIKHDLDTGLPFSDNALDLVVCSEILEHVLWPEALLKETFRVLKPRGVLILTVPNLHCIRNRLDVLCGKYTPFIEYRIYADRFDTLAHTGVQHIHHYTLGGMTSMLETVGFQVLRTVGESFHLNFLLPFRALYKLHGGDRGLRAALRLLSLGRYGGEHPGLALRHRITRVLGRWLPSLSPGLLFKARKS